MTLEIHPLTRVTMARVTLEEAQTSYRESLRAARVAGLTLAQIAEAAGVSRQAVYQLLLAEAIASGV
jgi:DNA-binding phage protein